MTVFLILSILLTIISIGLVLFKNINIKKIHAITLVIATPILLTIIYLQIGEPNTLLKQTISEQQAKDSKFSNKHLDNTTNSLNNLDPKKIEFAISKLKENIEKDPTDINSLNLLSNSYLLLEQHSNAAATLEKLIALGQNHTETLLKTINSYNFAEKGRINDRAYQLIKILLQQAPKHPQGLWIAGMSEIQRNNTIKAKEHWNTLIPILEGTPQQQELIKIIAQLDNSNIVSKQLPKNQTDAKSVTKIHIAIALSDNFDMSKVEPNDTVFVFATAKNGPPTPLAVKRFTVADLPASTTLTEQDAMLPEMNISAFDDMIISAKISKTGNPTDKNGDINSPKIQINRHQLKKEYLLKIQ